MTRAPCLVCGGLYRLRKNGGIWAHQWSDSALYCAGSGKPPAQLILTGA